jgi:DNA (cytosine-5)-methyltransferase 1
MIRPVDEVALVEQAPVMEQPGDAPKHSSQVACTCRFCGRVTHGAGPAARHQNACLDALARTAGPLTSFELFAGVGGLALGLARAGFGHLAIIERDDVACTSLRYNKPRVGPMSHWPIHKLDARTFDYAPYEGHITALSAGAPCQPFSQGGKRKGDEDERNMFPEVFRAVREIRPDVVIIENVKGLLREASKPYFSYILDQLRRAGSAPLPGEEWRAHHQRIKAAPAAPDELRYEVAYQLVNAADFGLPQFRERVFIIGFRSDLEIEWVPLRPTHSKDALLYSQWVDGSYWEEHGVAPPELPAKLAKKVERLRRLGQPGEMRWRTIRDALRGLPEPVDGVEDPHFTNHAGIPGARTYAGHTGSPYDQPAKTLKAGAHGVSGGENMLRRADGSVRYFTIREMARLQGLPDEYVVQGAWTRGMRQLGNAVPVDLAQAVAQHVRELLEQRIELALAA